MDKTTFFNGCEYCLVSRGRYYIKKTSKNSDRRSAKSLHVDVWEYHNKKQVPKGFVIHHKDFNPFNNDISNLELMENSEHRKLHCDKMSEDKKKRQRDHLSSIRDKASDWHKSDEGREWHSINAKRSWELIEQTEKECDFCGKTFKTKGKSCKFCSSNCWHKDSRRKKRGDLFGKRVEKNGSITDLIK